MTPLWEALLSTAPQSAPPHLSQPFLLLCFFIHRSLVWCYICVKCACLFIVCFSSSIRAEVLSIGSLLWLQQRGQCLAQSRSSINVLNRSCVTSDVLSQLTPALEVNCPRPIPTMCSMISHCSLSLMIGSVYTTAIGQCYLSRPFRPGKLVVKH